MADTPPTHPTAPIEGRPVRIALVGAGNRGLTYGDWIHAHPERARLTAVADPDPRARDRARADTGYDGWRSLLAATEAAGGPLADGVIVATQDRDHVEPVLALARAGYAIMTEKPLAPTEDECRTIVAGVEAAGVPFAVCHVLRYTPYTDLVRSVIASGVLGRLTGLDHLEPVGWWHYAHSYVRGPWRREDESAPMILAKSSHDLDWIAYVTGQRIETVASFGGLSHFRPENAPPGSTDNCLTCPAEPECPYSAPKLYYPALRRTGGAWPISHVTDRAHGPADRAVLTEALRTGPYGRCVYRSDNDVVDNQVVAMRLSGGATATFTMSAFTEQTHRQTRIFGSHGWLRGDGERVTVHDFRHDTVTVHEIGASGSNAADGHGGGDTALVESFVTALATGDRSHIRSGPAESLGSHLAAFAAERSRHHGTVETVPAR
ncbi:Gfo/Idh/MocA family protein [Streptomyces sp. NPDC092296]|uniref:Gfo/Idh/MocA family protein n=1 Tax=Streptomyces sp. NPDC092296 TaxID=3366012 RepID=UPI00382797EB